MRNARLRTRARAWFLRTFRGRSPQSAAWADDLPVSAGPPRAFTLGELRIDVQPKGLKAAGINPPSMVYEVRVARGDPPRAWTSTYGFAPRAGSAQAAADAALDELSEIAVDRETWWRRVTAGMTEEEAEAMEDSPAMQLDQHAAEWVAPELARRRPRRAETGSWLEDEA